MTDQRGLSLVELLVAAMLAAIVAGGLFSAYVATTRSFGESSAQAALQRQGTLVLEEIGRQVRAAVEPNPVSANCNGIADSVRVRTADAVMCYYARAADGALCEDQGTTCRDLLRGGLKTIELLRQPAPPLPPDPRCPAGIPAGARCFRMATVPSSVGPPTRVDLAFAIRDRDGDLDGDNVMAFSISLTCSGRNC